MKLIQVSSLSLKIAFIEFDSQQIEKLYTTWPNVKIIIDPGCIYQATLSQSYRYGKKDDKWQEEAAITIEQKEDREKESLAYFLEWFYSAQSLVEACKRYEWWQSQHLLDNHLENRLIDFFQIYEEEVFNYFKYLPYLKGVTE